MKVAGYGRASTDKQQLSCAMQETMVEEWIQHQMNMGKWKTKPDYVGFFADSAVSSKRDMLDRPAGQHLLPALDAGDMIVIAKYNRAFRSAGDAERTLDRMNRAKIDLVFMDLNIDTSTANGRMLAGILAVVSRHERDLRSETTRDAHNHLRKMMRPQGRRGPIGWKVVKKNRAKGIPSKFAVDLRMREQAYVALHRIQSGWSIEQVRQLLMDLYGKREWRDSKARRIGRYALAAGLGFPLIHMTELYPLLGISDHKLQYADYVARSEAEWESMREKVNDYEESKRQRAIELSYPGQEHGSYDGVA